MAMFDPLIRRARPLERWLNAELARIEREDWLADVKWRFPIGARIECRCRSVLCAGTWYVNGWNYEEMGILVVAKPELIGTAQDFTYTGEHPNYDWIPIQRFDRANPVARVVART